MMALTSQNLHYRLDQGGEIIPSLDAIDLMKCKSEDTDGGTVHRHDNGSRPHSLGTLVRESDVIDVNMWFGLAEGTESWGEKCVLVWCWWECYTDGESTSV